MDRKEKRRIRLSLVYQQNEIEDKHCKTCERNIELGSGATIHQKCKGCPHFSTLSNIGEALNNLTKHRQITKGYEQKYNLIRTVAGVENVLTAEKYLELADCHTDEEIRTMYNIDTPAFKRWKERYGINNRKRRMEETENMARAKVNIDERITAEQYTVWRKTMKCEAIAKKIGVGYSTLMQWAKEKGLTNQSKTKDEVKTHLTAASEKTVQTMEETKVEYSAKEQESEISALQAELRSVQDELHATRLQIQEKQHNHAVDTQHLREQIQLQKEIIDQLENDYAVKVAEVNNLDKEIKGLQISYSHAANERDEYRKVMHEVHERREYLEGENEKLENENNVLQEKVEILRAQIAEYGEYESFFTRRIEQLKKAAYI